MISERITQTSPSEIINQSIDRRNVDMGKSIERDNNSSERNSNSNGMTNNSNGWNSNSNEWNSNSNGMINNSDEMINNSILNTAHELVNTSNEWISKSNSLSHQEWSEMVNAANILTETLKANSLLKTKLMNIIQYKYHSTTQHNTTTTLSTHSTLSNSLSKPRIIKALKKSQIQNQIHHSSKSDSDNNNYAHSSDFDKFTPPPSQQTSPRPVNLFISSPSTSPTIKPSSVSSNAQSNALKAKRKKNIVEGTRRCCYCETTETPMWRHGPVDFPDLCNKCGMKWMRRRILQ